MKMNGKKSRPSIPTSSRSARAELLYTEHERLESAGQRDLALKKLEEAAKLGAIYAIYALAYEYYNGDPPRVKDAVRLYKRAAARGDNLSAWNLARHYEMKPMSKQYLYWLRKAFDMGMEEAGEELKSPFPYLVDRCKNLLALGRESDAIKYLKYASKNGNHEASAILEELRSRKAARRA